MGATDPSPRIEQTPGVLGGKPRIAGRRISVQHVVALHDRGGWSSDEIASEYDLTLADVYSALAYYFEHREEIDAATAQDEEFVKTLKDECVPRLRAAE
jgi:uncharacterized protein (DUF433 family)